MLTGERQKPKDGSEFRELQINSHHSRLTIPVDFMNEIEKLTQILNQQSGLGPPPLSFFSSAQIQFL
jgi:hypothetical protein